MLCSWGPAVGSLGQICPKLTHLTLSHCTLIHIFTPFRGCPGLEHLTLCGSTLMGSNAGVAHFLSAQLTSIDISDTGIADNGLRDIVSPKIAARKWAHACMQ